MYEAKMMSRKDDVIGWVIALYTNA
jgi:hypothetical protein